MNQFYRSKKYRREPCTLTNLLLILYHFFVYRGKKKKYNLLRVVTIFSLSTKRRLGSKIEKDELQMYICLDGRF